MTVEHPPEAIRRVFGHTRQLRGQVSQWSCEGGEVARVHHLDARIVIATEASRGVGAAGRSSSFRRAEPQPEVKCVDRLGRRARIRIRERPLIVYHRGRLIPRRVRDDERLAAEASAKALVPLPLIVSLDVALVPGQAEGGVGS